MFERVRGPEHPRTLIARHERAHWTGVVTGDAAAARDELAALLSVFERVLGPEHPRTLIAGHGRAHWTGEAGDPAAARDELAALLPVFEQVLGPRHPATLNELLYDVLGPPSALLAQFPSSYWALRIFSRARGRTSRLNSGVPIAVAADVNASRPVTRIGAGS